MQQNSSWVPLFPDQASTFAWQVDGLYFYLLAITAFFTVGIVAALIFLVIKYRERKSLRPARKFTARFRWKHCGRLFRSLSR